jgi:hypothetical protein
MLLLSPIQDVSTYLFVGEYAYSLGREVPVCERDVSWAASSRDGKHAILVINGESSQQRMKRRSDAALPL